MEKFVVTIARQFGSLGRPIAQRMSEKLGVEFYDRDIVDQAAQKLNLPVSKINAQEELAKKDNSVALFSRMAHPLGSDKTTETQDKIFETQQNIINFLVEKDSCIVVGRCSDFILNEKEHHMRVYIYAPYESRVKNSIEELGLAEEDARKMIRDVDKARDAYHLHYAGYKPNDTAFKDVMVDSSFLGIEGTADFLVDLVKRKFNFS